MRQLKYIIIVIMIYLLCSARTCTEDEGEAARREEQYISGQINKVERVFTSDTLGDDLLRAFEITAIYKLNEFSDYLKIISDTTIEIDFRQHAADLARALFLPGEITLNNWSRAYKKSGLNNIELLIQAGLTGELNYRIIPLDISVEDPFTAINDTLYKGLLGFSLNAGPIYNIPKPFVISGESEIDIYLIKTTKLFGEKQFRIWEVFLGDMD